MIPPKIVGTKKVFNGLIDGCEIIGKYFSLQSSA
jgi:hypothetical protein